MKTFITILSTVFTLFLLSMTAYAQSPDEAKIIGVKMDAEWCGKCQVLNPKMDNVMPEFKDHAVLFTKFNMTDEFTTQQAGYLAQKMGLRDLFEENKGQTGYMLLLDAETHEVLKRLTSDQSEEELIADIESILAVVE